MKKFLFDFLLLLFFMNFLLVLRAQTYSELLSVQLNASTQTTPTPQITLDWKNDGTANTYIVYRRNNTSISWGSPVSTLSASAFNYVDSAVSIGVAYEYKVVKTSNQYGYGYINTAIELPAVVNKGIIILVIEDTYIGNTNFDSAIDQTIADIENDGWLVESLNVNRNDAVNSVKTSILSMYNQNTSLTKAIYLIGHVPVPYSGLLNPDGHPDHLGAWPADVYYGDINGVWTDNTVNDNTSASQSRNHNIPGDGKFDQTVISQCELQVGRVDFANLTAFSQTEEELLINYLNKAHAYKSKEFTATERALIDDNFTSMPEGFATSGYRNFSSMFSSSNINDSVDLRTATNNDSYMWSYGCGAGSFSNCSGIGTTNNLASDSLQTVFIMLFGSYFGDWDSNNNFLRAAIAQGQTLNSMWAGRPQWEVHHMALGENIGFSSLLTQNNTNYYFGSTLNVNAFAKWVHISLMGDPTLRMNYITPPSNLIVTNNNNVAELSWIASPDNVLGYNIYRLDENSFTYIKVNSNIVTDSSFMDNTISSAGLITYIVKAVNLKTTASGSYYNQSLGIRNSCAFSVGVYENIDEQIVIYPNPTNNLITVDINGYNGSFNVEIYDLQGRLLETTKARTVSLKKYSKGIYIFRVSYGDITEELRVLRD